MVTKKEVNFEYYRLFVYSWNKIHSYYDMSHTKTDHLMLPVYEHLSSKVDPTKGAPSSYIFRGVRMVLRGRRITMASETVRKYSYVSECTNKHQDSPESSHITKTFVNKLIKETTLSPGEKRLLHEMFFVSMGSAEDARRSMGNPYSRARLGQVYSSLIKKLRATYKRLEEGDDNT